MSGRPQAELDPTVGRERETARIAAFVLASRRSTAAPLGPVTLTAVLTQSNPTSSIVTP